MGVSGVGASGPAARSGASVPAPSPVASIRGSSLATMGADCSRRTIGLQPSSASRRSPAASRRLPVASRQPPAAPLLRLVLVLHLAFGLVEDRLPGAVRDHHLLGDHRRVLLLLALDLGGDVEVGGALR